MRMFRLWCMALCLVFAGASFASAHRVNIFAFVDGDAVQVECGFNRSQKVKQGTVEVFDATTGALLLQGTTDDKVNLFFLLVKMALLLLNRILIHCIRLLH